MPPKGRLNTFLNVIPNAYMPIWGFTEYEQGTAGTPNNNN